MADLDTRLAEFDRKLREIQSDLAPERDRPPARTHEAHAASEAQAASADHARGRSGPLADLLLYSPPVPPREPQPGPREAPSVPSDAQLVELGRLLGSLHDVLDGIEALLSRMAAGSRQATIAAGPFSTIQEVREFERELATVPGVRNVTVRGYEGAARAIIDVHLGEDH